MAESCPCPCSLGERPLTISYAEPKQSEMNQDQVKSVYVGNLPEHTSEDSLRTYFEKLEMGKVGNIRLPCPGCTLLPSAAGKEPVAAQSYSLPGGFCH